MRTIKLNIQDNVFDKVYYFLSNLPKSEVEIVEYSNEDDLSTLESEIEKSLNSKVLKKSHDKIFDELIKKYAELRKVSVSELIRQTVMERIEDEYDLAAYERAMEAYKKRPITYTHAEVVKMLTMED